MTRRRGPRSLGSALTSTTLVWVVVVIVVLIVIDVALVTFAIGKTAPAPSAQRPVPTFSDSPRASATPTPSATAAAVSTRRFLSAVNGREAFRAIGGTCGGEAPSLEHTTDAGVTWTSVPLESEVSTILSIRATSTGLSILGGAGGGCVPTVRSTTDGGATWTGSDVGAAGAGVSPAGIVLAAGVVDPPCSDPVEAFEGQQTTVVICDGQFEWRSGTGQWVDVPLGGVRSMADAGNHYTLARIGTSTCAGVEIESMSAVGVTHSTRTTPVGCAADVPAGGTVSLARAGDDVWLWADTSVSVSSDGGATW